MRVPVSRTVLPGILALTVAACAPEAEPREAVEAPPVAVRQTAASSLPPEVIERLKEEYAVLRQDPAPEPRPSPDANPAELPERLRGAVGEKVLRSATGGATFYASHFEGRRTASGIPFRQNQMVAAHRSFPFGTLLRVTNLDNGRAANVRVVDRGPFGSAAKRHRTLVDLSRRAATELGFVGAGRAEVRVEVLEWGEGLPRVG